MIHAHHDQFIRRDPILFRRSSSRTRTLTRRRTSGVCARARRATASSRASGCTTRAARSPAASLAFAYRPATLCTTMGRAASRFTGWVAVQEQAAYIAVTAALPLLEPLNPDSHHFATLPDPPLGCRRVRASSTMRRSCTLTAGQGYSLWRTTVLTRTRRSSTSRRPRAHGWIVTMLSSGMSLKVSARALSRNACLCHLLCASLPKVIEHRVPTLTPI